MRTPADDYAAELETLRIEQPRRARGVYVHTTGKGKEWRATVLRGNWPLYISPTEPSPGRAYEHAQAFIQLLKGGNEK